MRAIAKAVVLGFVLIFSGVALADDPILPPTPGTDTMPKTTTMVRRACKDVDFLAESWPQLLQLEPKIATHWDGMVRAYHEITGGNLTFENLDNCVVDFPVNEDNKAIDGYRIVLMSKLWFGDMGTKKYQAGMKITYYMSYTDIGTQLEQRRRQMLGFSVCKETVACTVLDIPIKLSTPPAPLPTRVDPRRTRGSDTET